MTPTAAAESPHARTWEQTGPNICTTLMHIQNKTLVDLSGVTVTEKTIEQDGRRVRISIIKPSRTKSTPPVFLFLHGGVWIAGDFENHKRFVRDLVVGSGAAAVFPEYTPAPDAGDPTRIEEVRATARWVAIHGSEIGVDGSRMAVVGNTCDGNMAAVLSLMVKDPGRPTIRLQMLFYPATGTHFETELYEDFERMGAFWRRTS